MVYDFLVSFFFHFISIPCYARECPDPWVTYSWARALLCSFLVISIFNACHIHYVSKVLALLLYKHNYIVVRDCFQLRKLSLRQIRSLFFFSRSDSYQCCWNQLVCPTHSEAKKKQKGWSLEWRKFYCRAMQGERGGSCPKDVNSLDDFPGRLFTGKIGRGTAGCVTLIWLVGGCVPGTSMINLLVLISLEFRS